MKIFTSVVAAILLCALPHAQQRGTQGGRGPGRGPSVDPFPQPIESTQGVIALNFVEFATIPDVNGEAPRMMHLVDEPGTRRMFVSAMHGSLYSVSYDGKTVTEYLDVNAPAWAIGVQSMGSERGLQSFVFHPQFNQRGARGYGKFYVYTDTPTVTPKADFTPLGQGRTHDTLLLEWTAKDPTASKYDGAAPRELMRFAQPFQNHNGGEVAFNRLAAAGSPEYGLLYIGAADGGSGGDPFNMAQNLSSAFGKILRIDPFGSNSANGKYGIPAANPFVSDGKPETLGEIYAYGVRNPQRFSWDPKTGRMFVADIGQNVVEEVSEVTAGGNLGWNRWEGSFAYANRSIQLANPRSEPGLVYPVVEFDHNDPLLQRSAVTGVYVYRQAAIKPLANRLVFGDNPSGEIFYVNADRLPNGGQDAIRRILFNDKGTPKTLLQLIREKNTAQGKTPAARADMRLGEGPQGQIFVLNKRDGVIRLFVP
jgi:hypothetical protein